MNSYPRIPAGRNYIYFDQDSDGLAFMAYMALQVNRIICVVPDNVLSDYSSLVCFRLGCLNSWLNNISCDRLHTQKCTVLTHRINSRLFRQHLAPWRPTITTFCVPPKASLFSMHLRSAHCTLIVYCTGGCRLALTIVRF
jgi:hypothetical protein